MPKGAGRLHSHRDAAGTIQPERIVCAAERQDRLPKYCGLGRCNAVQWVGGVSVSTSTARAVQLPRSTAQGATAFQECEPLRMLSAMGFRQNSLPFELEAGSGQRAEATGAFDIIGEMVATEERREYPEGV